MDSVAGAVTAVTLIASGQVTSYRVDVQLDRDVAVLDRTGFLDGGRRRRSRFVDGGRSEPAEAEGDRERARKQELHVVSFRRGVGFGRRDTPASSS